MTMDQKVDHLLTALCEEWPERADWFKRYVAAAREEKCEPFHIYSWLLRHMLRACLVGHWFEKMQGIMPTHEFSHNKIVDDPRGLEC